MRQQAAGANPVEVHLRADGGRSGPERECVGQRRERLHEVGSPRRAVRLHVLPEVALGALGAVDGLGGGGAQHRALRDRVLDEVLDLEEHAGVALVDGDPDGAPDLAAAGQQPRNDALLDERVGIDDGEVEGHVVGVAQHVEHAVHVGPGDLEVRDHVVEVTHSHHQPLAPHTEVRGAGQLDVLLNLDVAEHQLGHRLGERLRSRDGQLKADLARWLVVDTTHDIPPLWE